MWWNFLWKKWIFRIFCGAGSGPGSGSTQDLRGGVEMVEMMVFFGILCGAGPWKIFRDVPCPTHHGQSNGLEIVVILDICGAGEDLFGCGLTSTHGPTGGMEMLEMVVFFGIFLGWIFLCVIVITVYSVTQL